MDIAIFNKNEIVSKILKDNGAVSSSLSTPFGIHQAAEFGHADLLRTLGADNEALNKTRGVNEWTPLHVASWYGNEKAVEVLVQLGANVLAQDKEGRTALHLALLKRRRRVIRVLLNAPNYEELVKIKDNKGLSVLDNDPKNDKSLVSVIDRRVNKSYKTTTEEVNMRRGARGGKLPRMKRDIRRTRTTLRGGRGVSAVEALDNLDIPTPLFDVPIAKKTQEDVDEGTVGWNWSNIVN